MDTTTTVVRWIGMHRCKLADVNPSDFLKIALLSHCGSIEMNYEWDKVRQTIRYFYCTTRCTLCAAEIELQGDHISGCVCMFHWRDDMMCTP